MINGAVGSKDICRDICTNLCKSFDSKSTNFPVSTDKREIRNVFLHSTSNTLYLMKRNLSELEKEQHNKLFVNCLQKNYIQNN